MSLFHTELRNIEAAQRADSSSTALLLDAKFSPVLDKTDALHRQVLQLESDVEGLSIAATDGAAARDRRLGGKLEAVQQIMVDIQLAQLITTDTLQSLRKDITRLQHWTARADTFVITKTDTFIMQKGRSWWKKLSPLH